MKKFKISVIVPIYNTEQYLEDAIESVVSQSLGFEEGIQLILVNNATQDNSEQICLKYKAIYPENVVYIKLEKNIGVSGARNCGIDAASGETVSFLDSDDMWDSEALQKLYDYLKQNWKAVDFVVARIKKFEAEVGYFGLDYKFDKGTRIVDILKEPNMKQFGVVSCLMKRDVFGKHRFDERVHHAEDVRMINGILLDNCKYGLVKEALYHYRVRNVGGSLMQTRQGVKNWYIETVAYVYQLLVELSREKYDEVLPYIQYIIHNDMRVRLPFPENMPLLSEEEKIWYRTNIRNLLCQIRDEIILSDEWTSPAFKEYELLLKYNEGALEDSYIKGKDLCFRHFPIREIRDGKSVQAPKNHYLFPFGHIDKDSEIYIYGGGDIGTQYIRQVSQCGYCHILGIIDVSGRCIANFDFPVVRPDEFDYTNDMKIVIAIFDEKVAGDVKKMLIDKGLKPEQIVWNVMRI